MVAVRICYKPLTKGFLISSTDKLFIESISCIKGGTKGPDNDTGVGVIDPDYAAENNNSVLHLERYCLELILLDTAARMYHNRLSMLWSDSQTHHRDRMSCQDCFCEMVRDVLNTRQFEHEQNISI